MSNLLLKTNKYFIRSLFFMTLATWTQVASALSVEQVYKSALNNNSDLLILKAKVEEREAFYFASYSNYLPRLGVESRYEFFNSDFEKVNGGTAHFYLDYNLFNGFKDLQNTQILKADKQIAIAEKERLENNIQWQTYAYYTKVQVLQENIKTYQQLIADNQKNIISVKNRKNSGRISESDFLEFEIFDTMLKQKLIGLESELTAQQIELQRFAGMKINESLTSVLKPSKLNLDHTKLEQILQSEKSKLYEHQLKMNTSERRIKLSQGGYLPRLNLKMTYGSLGLRETTVSPETAILLQAQWEFFSGFETRNETKMALAQFKKEKTNFEVQKMTLESRVKQLTSIINKTYEQFNVADPNLLKVEKYLSTVKSEYQRGVKSSNELITAIELSIDAQINRNELKNQFFQACVELQDILGQTIQEKE